jgi:hypothetical protein
MLSIFLDCPFWTTSVFFNVYLSAENDIMVKSYGNRKQLHHSQQYELTKGKLHNLPVTTTWLHCRFLWSLCSSPF